MTKLYWLIPLILAVVQLIFTINSQSQIRYEELAEGIRNPFWLENRLIYDGTSSNIGWYGSLLIVYKIFGFGLFHAKYFRLFLHLLSLLCLAALLRRFLGQKLATLPLLVIGLSPSLLFLNTLETSYGIDLQYFPITLFLMVNQLNWVRALGWAVAMLAWTSYPPFILYLPVLFFVAIRKNLLLNLVSFLAPLLIAFIYVQNRQILFFDPKLNSGLFRGAGTLQFDADQIAANLAGLTRDLFFSGQSYHFELNKGEFSLIFPLLTVIFVLGTSLRWLKKNRYLLLAWVMLVAAILLPSLTLDPSGQPGMRRFSPVLVAFYGLFTLVWWRFHAKLGIMALSLLLIHHLIVLPINLAHMKDMGPYQEPILVSSFNSLVQSVQREDLRLGCPEYCRVVEAYAAVSAACTWNHLNCHQILGWDPKTGQLIPLSHKLWDDYYFEH